MVGAVREEGGPGWVGKSWEMFVNQKKVREPIIEKVVPLEMGNFMEASWKGFWRKVEVEGWVRDKEAQTSSEINMGKEKNDLGGWGTYILYCGR